MSTAERAVVVLPTYNEAATIARVVEQIHLAVPEADILVVDDGSPDGTGQIVDDLAAVDSRISALHRTVKEGLGAAYLAGFATALQQGYEVVVEMDADGSHRPEDLPRLLARIADADLVLGSRYADGGRVVNWPRRRQVLSRWGNVYARLALGISVRDATGGYRAFRASTLRRLDLAGVASQGYCFQIDLVWRAIRAGMTVVEVPITFVEREEGTSKMNGAIVREALVRVTRWGVAHRVGQAKSALRRPTTRGAVR